MAGMLRPTKPVEGSEHEWPEPGEPKGPPQLGPDDRRVAVHVVDTFGRPLAGEVVQAMLGGSAVALRASPAGRVVVPLPPAPPPPKEGEAPAEEEPLALLVCGAEYAVPTGYADFQLVVHRGE